MRRTLKNNAEVAHVWAQQNQSTGKSGSMFFEERSIYSYGNHFEIARFVKSKVVLLTTRSYSVTTSHHQSLVQGAVSHLQTFTVPSFTDHKENIQSFIDSAKDYAEKAKRARGYGDSLISGIRRSVADLHQYIYAFAKDIEDTLWAEERMALDLHSFLSPREVNTITARSSKWEEERAIRREIRQKALAQRQRVNLEKWKAGQGGTVLDPYVDTALRIKGDNVETSRGANVPLKIALKMYHKLKKGQDVAGVSLGHYKVDSANGVQLTAGCHTIPYVEMDRIHAGLECCK